jgi:transcriptional regulator with XRE-family HTH domain
VYSDLGRRLKLARVAVGLTQRELAERAGVSQSIVAKIEAGRSKRPQPMILMQIAKALSLPEGLFLEKEKMKEQREAESLEKLLVESGVSEEAAAMIVRALRRSARRELQGALQKEKERR